MLKDTIRFRVDDAHHLHDVYHHHHQQQHREIGRFLVVSIMIVVMIIVMMMYTICMFANEYHLSLNYISPSFKIRS